MESTKKFDRHYCNRVELDAKASGDYGMSRVAWCTRA
jgi:hypothetical protein